MKTLGGESFQRESSPEVAKSAFSVLLATTTTTVFLVALLPSKETAFTLETAIKQLPLVILQVLTVYSAYSAIAHLFSRDQARSRVGGFLLYHGACLCIAWLNSKVYHWTQFTLFSPEGLLILQRVPIQLLQFTTPAIARDLFLGGLAIAAYLATFWKLTEIFAEGKLSRHASFLRSRHLVALFLACISVSLVLTSAIRHQAAQQPTKNPVAIFLGHTEVKQRIEKVPNPDAYSDRGEAGGFEFVPNDPVQLATAIDSRRREQRIIRTQVRDGETIASPPPLLIVILESFRYEVLNSEVMPWLSEQADRGIVCRNHYSGGNASSHGIFSLVNGLEAFWFQQPVTYTPLLNRLLHQANFELGFFGSKDDWRSFYMDGYIHQQHYDVFHNSSYRGVATDRRTLSLAMRFLSADDPPAKRKTKRVGIVYLYSTHAPYESYAGDQIFQPAADNRISYPYGKSDANLIWNRYRNSAHSLDRLLSAIHSKHWNVVVTGDHGESFLDDGTIGHGTRINSVQNRTPAIFFGPSFQKRDIRSVTTHADILPTILDSVGVQVNLPHVFDGVPLQRTAETTLNERLVSTRDYLTNRVGIIGGSWTNATQPGFLLSDFDLSLPAFEVRQYTDALGNAIEIQSTESAQDTLDHWIIDRFTRKPQ